MFQGDAGGGDRAVVERWLPALAAAVLVGSLALGAVGSRASAGGDRVAFDAPVPAEYDFAVPGAGGTATVDGETYDSLERALAAAQPGDRVVLEGRFDGTVTVDTPGITLTSTPGRMAVLDGGGDGDVLTVAAPNVTVDRVWVRNSGFDPADNDAGVWIDAPNVRVVDARVSAVTFGVWVDGVDDVVLANNTVVGRERVTPLSDRGNGIQLWRTSDTVVRGNRITDVRDGVYFSWAEDVRARNNAMWDLRYGVHFMYSDGCRLANNTAFDNDVGYALMVSKHLELVDNVAVNNTGSSGHGIMLKSIDETTIRGNDLVANDRGLYVYNSLDNVLADNLVLDNGVGVHLTAGSVRERVTNNTFLQNGAAVRAVVGRQVAWNASGRGNYWGGATVADLDGDGVSEVRHRPAGLVDDLRRRNPQVGVFANSPAFRAVRVAESTVPAVESPGVVDHHPLVTPRHDWRRYYDHDR